MCILLSAVFPFLFGLFAYELLCAYDHMTAHSE